MNIDPLFDAPAPEPAAPRTWPGVLLRLAAVAVSVWLIAPRAQAIGPTSAGTGAASSALREAAAYRPWDDVLWGRAARAALAEGDPAGTLAVLDEIAARRPLTGADWLLRAEASAALGDDAGAVAAWEQARALGAASPVALRALAQAYLDAGNLTGARALADELAAAGAPDADLLLGLARALAADAPADASALVAQAAAADPARAAWLAPLQDALDQAADDPADVRAARLGVAYLLMGELADAEDAFLRAVAYRPDYAEALAYLAYTRAQREQPALGAAQQAAALQPDSPTVNYLNGLVWMTISRPVEARQAFEQAFVLSGGDAAYAVDVARTHRIERRYASAELWLQEAVARSDEALAYRMLLVQFYLDEEYLVAEHALPLAESLVADAPDNAEAHDALGWAAFLTGDLDLAFAELDRALALDPTLPRANFHRGALLESQGRLAEAVDAYRRASDADPAGAFGALARRALERIGTP